MKNMVSVSPTYSSTPDPESLQDELLKLERIALIAGLEHAADWIRSNYKHVVVWVEDEDDRPMKMLSWMAKERGLHVITCAVCNRPATAVDNYHPHYQTYDRCDAHIDYE